MLIYSIFFLLMHFVNLNLSGGRKVHPLPPPSFWFFLNNSEAVNAVTLTYLSELSNNLLGTSIPKLGVPNLSQSPDIKQSSDEGISNFQTSCQSLIKENCYTSRANSDIVMKLGPIPKLDKRNKMTSNKIDNGVMLAKCDVIVDCACQFIAKLTQYLR